MVNRTTQATYPLGTLVNSLGLATYYNHPQSAKGSLPEAEGGQDAFCKAASQAYGGDLNGYQSGCEEAALNLIQNLDPEVFVTQLKNSMFDAPVFSLRTSAPTNKTIRFLRPKPMSVRNPGNPAANGAYRGKYHQ